MPRPVVHDATLRATLLDEAAAAIATHGVDSLSLRSVATAAQTSTSAIYSLFGDKAALVEAVAAQAEVSFRTSQEAASTSNDPLADLRALGRAYRAWAHAHPSLYAVMFAGRVPNASGDHQDCGSAPTEPSIAPLVAAVSRAHTAGLIGGGDPETITVGIWAMIHGLVSLELAAGKTGQRGALAASVEDYLDAMLRAWPPSGTPASSEPSHRLRPES